jgi:Protein of unknown function (DUF1501)
MERFDRAGSGKERPEPGAREERELLDGGLDGRNLRPEGAEDDRGLDRFRLPLGGRDGGSLDCGLDELGLRSGRTEGSGRAEKPSTDRLGPSAGITRRGFFRVLGAAGAGLALAQLGLQRALAAASAASDEFFIFIHAAGGWDITLWSDPRNQRKGLVEPASTDNTDWSQIRLYQPAAVDADTNSFQILQAPNGMLLGPTLGNLFSLASRLALFNGLAMNTVSHPDGTWFSATGRHLAGGRPVASSIDTMVSNELGGGQLFPTVSVNFPSSFLGAFLDPRVVPLRVGSIGTIARSLTRSAAFDTAAERDAVTVLLSQEAADLARMARDPAPMEGFASQYQSLRAMLDPTRPGGSLTDVFSQAKLQANHPEFNYKARFQAGTAVNAAFAVEAMARNLARSVSFATSGSFDTHNTNYRNQALVQQELFDLLAALVTRLDALPHPTRTSDKLSDHTHILVISDFCRTPMINLSGGRDHYPSNTALAISPRFRNKVIGGTDLEQVLPVDAGTFQGETRPLTPADVLATFVGAFGIDPRKYLRDGVVLTQMLAT